MMNVGAAYRTTQGPSCGVHDVHATRTMRSAAIVKGIFGSSMNVLVPEATSTPQAWLTVAPRRSQGNRVWVLPRSM